MSATAELTHLFRAMKAPAAGRALPKLCERARQEEWTYERFTEALLSTEIASRDASGGEQRIKAARFPARKTLSSESTYSLMEFMREFPDDAACLEHLWRSRHAPDGEHATCPKCKQERVFRRYATAQGRPVLDLYGVRAPRTSDGGDDLREVLHVAAPVVLRDVSRHEHSVWDLRQAARALARRVLPDGMADAQQDP